MKTPMINAKKLMITSLLLLLLPFLFFATALLQQSLNISMPSVLWLEKYSLHWSSGLRILVFALAMIVIPLIAAILSFSSIVKLQSNKGQADLPGSDWLILL